MRSRSILPSAGSFRSRSKTTEPLDDAVLRTLLRLAHVESLATLGVEVYAAGCMGIEIERDNFTDADYAAYDVRLRACLKALEQLATRPGFGDGPMSLGAEVELDLVDESDRPSPKNKEVLSRIGDPRVTLELDRFNLEIN